jgi:hypothetical protein
MTLETSAFIILLLCALGLVLSPPPQTNLEDDSK